MEIFEKLMGYLPKTVSWMYLDTYFIESNELNLNKILNIIPSQITVYNLNTERLVDQTNFYKLTRNWSCINTLLKRLIGITQAEPPFKEDSAKKQKPQTHSPLPTLISIKNPSIENTELKRQLEEKTNQCLELQKQIYALKEQSKQVKVRIEKIYQQGIQEKYRNEEKIEELKSIINCY